MARYVNLVIPDFAACRARLGNAPARAAQFAAGNAGHGSVRLPVIDMVPAARTRSPHPGADDPAAGDHLAEELTALEHVERVLSQLLVKGLLIIVMLGQQSRSPFIARPADRRIIPALPHLS